MPWWGWLIAFCVGFLGITWLTVAVVTTRMASKAMMQFDENTDKMVERLRRGRP